MSSGIPLGQMLDMLEGATLRNNDTHPPVLGVSYARLVPTAAGGEVQLRAGSASPGRMMGAMEVKRLLPFPGIGQTVLQIVVSGCMRHAIGRVITDPFEEAVTSFSKKAKKLGKKI